jgi:hypothetical protein
MSDLNDDIDNLRSAANALRKAKVTEKAAEKKLAAAYAAMTKAAGALLDLLNDPNASKQRRASAAASADRAQKAVASALASYGQARSATEKAEKSYRSVLLDLVADLLRSSILL